MRFDESNIRLGCGRLNYHRQKLRLILGCFQFLPQIVGIDSEAVFDLGKALLQRFQVIAHEQNAERRVAIDEHSAFAVEHGPARGDNRDGTYTVTFREIGKMAGLHDLELPEADHE